MSDDNTVHATGIDRRDAIKAMALLPFAVAWDLSPPQIERATRVFTSEGPRSYVPLFFDSREWETVRLLADYIIPRDSRSGSATDAKVPEYIDWLLADKEASEASRVAMQGGLAWLDLECSERFGKTFTGSTDSERRQVLDDIAWPKKAPATLAHGVVFFNRFRDLTAAGFFSSEMGYKDVRFVGNIFNPGWQGCPPEAMAKLGVSHDLMRTRVPVE